MIEGIKLFLDWVLYFFIAYLIGYSTRILNLFVHIRSCRFHRPV